MLEIREGDAVSIKQIEVSIVNRAWDEGWIVPQPPARRDRPHGRRDRRRPGGPGRRAAAAPRRATRSRSTSATRPAAGWCASACRTSRSRSGSSSAGSSSCSAEGVRFEYGVDVGVDISAARAARRARRGRDRHRLARPARPAGPRPRAGRRALRDGVPLRPRARASRATPPADPITAAGKHVLVVGGGDTGADCVGHSHREGAASVTQIELLGEPPERRPDDLTPWPRWPVKLRTSYALKEGGERDFAISTTQADRQRPRAGGALGPEQRQAAVRGRSPGTEEIAPGRARAAGDGLPAPGAAAAARRSASSATRAATPRRARTRRRPRACSPRVTRAAASR